MFTGEGAMHDAVLLIDDDPLLCHQLAASLQQQGFRVQTAGDAERGLALARRQRPDLVLLEISLPGMDGLDALSIFQGELRLPVILLTRRSRPEDEALGLELGADDYVAKPYDLERLVARIRTVLRRNRWTAGSQATQPLALDCLSMDPAGRVACVGTTRLDLSPREFDLLYNLAARAGQVVSGDALLAQVWGVGFAGEPQVLYVNISKLRRKLASVPGHSLRLVTVHRVGYKLVEGG
jgi:DNA-binding response OmpR family regulator